jgi:hypothetical protein
MVVLEKALLETIKLRLEVNHVHKEADGLYFIRSGEGVVYNKESGVVKMPLQKSMLFGDSPLTRKVSMSTLGEIRSGLRPMSLIKFHHTDLFRILTYPELESIRRGSVHPEVERGLRKWAKSNN